MGGSDSHFAADWLSLREPADAAARAPALVEHLNEHFDRTRGPTDALDIIDLGCGHGSNLRYLAQRLPRPQRWLLVDQDPVLLDRAKCSCTQAADITTRQADLGQMDWRLLDRASLVTASALFDLATNRWIQDLATQCFNRRIPALFCLTVDGRRHFTDAHGKPCERETDALMRDWFNHHQRRPKSFADEGSLGPEAARILPVALEAAGFEVKSGPSDWRLVAGQADTTSLGLALLDGWRQSVLEIEPEQVELIDLWYQRRALELENRQIGITVGHVDVLALPPDEP